MEAGQGCGNRADAVDFIAQVGYAMAEGVDGLAVCFYILLDIVQLPAVYSIF